MFFAIEGNGQNPYFINGKIFDKLTNEVLPYVTVYDISSKKIQYIYVLSVVSLVYCRNWEVLGRQYHK